MEHVAIYCRVSNEDQKERETIEKQIDVLHTYMGLRDDLEIYDLDVNEFTEAEINQLKRLSLLSIQ